ncbi:butyrophilin subfamily 3 member A3-like [Plectropomus leopardus]|uniref:butyrophilin subfamily 3 member A3-like n=1 Tax=Plectropomus leopardus TaxID=160734 RepID=UPI001C4B6B69|nr:butyrophilin subfamily 3 member A3-like [Plectropomus leopardus]
MLPLGQVVIVNENWFSIYSPGSGDVTVISTEGSDAVLPCSLATKENIESKLFDWTKAAQKDGLRKEVFYYRNGIQNNGQSEEFKGRVFHFQDELKNGNASIIIRNTKINDTGNYTCVFPKLQDPQTKQLIVVPILRDRSDENKAAIRQPIFRIVHATDDGALLQCDVRGAFPKPRLQVQDSSGKNLFAEEPQRPHSDGRYYVTLNATVTKTDRYRCVVTQEEIHHQTHAETFVHISGKVCEDSSGKVAIGWLFGSFVLGIVVVVAVQALLAATKIITISRNKGSRLLLNSSHNQENGASHLENGKIKDSSADPLNS